MAEHTCNICASRGTPLPACQLHFAAAAFHWTFNLTLSQKQQAAAIKPLSIFQFGYARRGILVLSARQPADRMGAQVRDHDTDSLIVWPWRNIFLFWRTRQLLPWLEQTPGGVWVFNSHADWHSLISPAGKRNQARPGQARPCRDHKTL